MNSFCVPLILLVLYAKNCSCHSIYEVQTVHSDYEHSLNEKQFPRNLNSEPYDSSHRKNFNDDGYVSTTNNAYDDGYVRKTNNDFRRTAYNYENSNSYNKYVCDKKSPYYTPNHPKCMVPEDKCNSTSINFMPNHQDCADKCDETGINYQPNHPDCPDGCMDPCNSTCTNFDPTNPQCPDEQCLEDPCCPESPIFDPDDPLCNCEDPCNSDCPNFDPEDPLCTCDDPCNSDCPNFDPEDDCGPDPEKPVCQAMLAGINATLCEIHEEYQALTCGECPDVEVDIEDMTEACRSPSPDLIDCTARIGTVEKNGQTCKMFEFKFKRSTMSQKCKKPKNKYPSYSPKHAPIYRKPRYQKQIRTAYVNKRNGAQGNVKYGIRGYPKTYIAPKKLFQPKRMVTVLKKRWW